MSFQIIIDTTTRDIIGVGINADGTFDPGTDPGQGYAIETINNDALYQVIVDAPSATLGADGQSVTTPAGTFT